MMTMINQILDFTRLRANAMPLDRKPTDLLELAGRALDELRPLSEEKRIRVDLAAEGHAFTVLGDEGSLARVVVNLLGNALHFTAAGGAVRARLAEPRTGSSSPSRTPGSAFPPTRYPGSSSLTARPTARARVPASASRW